MVVAPKRNLVMIVRNVLRDADVLNLISLRVPLNNVVALSLTINLRHASQIITVYVQSVVFSYIYRV